MRTLLLRLSLLGLSLGCGGTLASVPRSQFAVETKCDETAVRVLETRGDGPNGYVVTVAGCGEQATYRCAERFGLETGHAVDARCTRER